MSSLLVKALANKIALIVNDFSPDQISLKFLTGKAELTNLNLNVEEISRMAQLPANIRLSSITVSKVAAKIPLTKLKTESMVINVENVIVVIDEVDPSTVQSSLLSVEQGSSNTQLATDQQNETSQPAVEQKRGLVEEVVDNMSVNVDMIRVEVYPRLRFANSREDDPTQDDEEEEEITPGLKIEISDVSLRCCDGNWEPTNVQGMRQAAQGSPVVPVYRHIAVGAVTMTVLGGEKDSKIVQPFLDQMPLEIKLVVNMSTSNNKPVSTHVEVNLDHVDLVMPRPQWRALLVFVDSVMAMVERAQDLIAKQQQKLDGPLFPDDIRKEKENNEDNENGEDATGMDDFEIIQREKPKKKDPSKKPATSLTVSIGQIMLHLMYGEKTEQVMRGYIVMVFGVRLATIETFKRLTTPLTNNGGTGKGISKSSSSLSVSSMSSSSSSSSSSGRGRSTSIFRVDSANSFNQLWKEEMNQIQRVEIDSDGRVSVEVSRDGSGEGDDVDGDEDELELSGDEDEQDEEAIGGDSPMLNTRTSSEKLRKSTELARTSTDRLEEVEEVFGYTKTLIDIEVAKVSMQEIPSSPLKHSHFSLLLMRHKAGESEMREIEAHLASPSSPMSLKPGERVTSSPSKMGKPPRSSSTSSPSLSVGENSGEPASEWSKHIPENHLVNVRAQVRQWSPMTKEAIAAKRGLWESGQMALGQDSENEINVSASDFNSFLVFPEQGDLNARVYVNPLTVVSDMDTVSELLDFFVHDVRLVKVKPPQQQVLPRIRLTARIASPKIILPPAPVAHSGIKPQALGVQCGMSLLSLTMDSIAPVKSSDPEVAKTETDFNAVVQVECLGLRMDLHDAELEEQIAGLLEPTNVQFGLNLGQFLGDNRHSDHFSMFDFELDTSILLERISTSISKDQFSTLSKVIDPIVKLMFEQKQLETQRLAAALQSNVEQDMLMTDLEFQQLKEKTLADIARILQRSHRGQQLEERLDRVIERQQTKFDRETRVLEQTLISSRVDNANLDLDMQNLKHENNLLSFRNNELEEKNKELEDELRKHRIMVNNLQIEQEEYEAQLVASKMSLGVMDEALVEFQQREERSERKMEKLESRLEVSEAGLRSERMFLEMINLGEQVEQLETSLDQQKVDMQLLQDVHKMQLEDGQQQLAEMESRMEKEAEEHQAAVESMEDHVRILQQQLEEAYEKLLETKTQVEESEHIRQDLERLQAEVEEKKNRRKLPNFSKLKRKGKEEEAIVNESSEGRDGADGNGMGTETGTTTTTSTTTSETTEEQPVSEGRKSNSFFRRISGEEKRKSSDRQRSGSVESGKKFGKFQKAAKAALNNSKSKGSNVSVTAGAKWKKLKGKMNNK